MKPHLFGLLAMCTLIATSLGSAANADDPLAQAIAADRAKIHGAWRISSLVISGDEADQSAARKLVVVNGDDGTWTLLAEGKHVVRGTSEIDPTKRPKTLDFTPTEGDSKGQLFLGIYELGETHRRMCFAPAGKERPQEFSSPRGSGLILLTFDRESAGRTEETKNGPNDP